jgi:hypothetical protein
MKAIAKTFIILTMLTVVSFGVMASEVVTDTVGDATTKHKSLFIHKAQKRLLGGQVEIFSNGELLATQTLHKKKMVIDFNDAKLGMYTIRITKGIDKKEFKYVKK